MPSSVQYRNTTLYAQYKKHTLLQCLCVFALLKLHVHGYNVDACVSLMG